VDEVREYLVDVKIDGILKLYYLNTIYSSNDGEPLECNLERFLLH